MDAASVAEIVGLSKKQVSSVFDKLQNNTNEIERALHTYLEGGGGAFKEAESGGAAAKVA